MGKEKMNSQGQGWSQRWRERSKRTNGEDVMEEEEGEW